MCGVIFAVNYPEFECSSLQLLSYYRCPTHSLLSYMRDTYLQL